MKRRHLFALTAATLAASCSAAPDAAAPTVPTEHGSPWPKFRGNAAQTGASAITPKMQGGAYWDYKTQKGIFSSPVVSADGTIYFGSADRSFYALSPDGSLLWKVDTGEIIDSSGLLDDRGAIYFGSGDGKLRAVDAKTGSVRWTMQADDPKTIGSFINWFEGNVAIAPDGSLVVPNDDFYVYSVSRDDGSQKWRYKMPDQTWSSPAIDAKNGTIYIGNNNLLPLLGKNTFSITPDGQTTNWSMVSLGTVAASPMLVGDEIVVGGFDGYAHAYATSDGTERWKLATRDHIYASPALLPDGSVVQPSADGTIYAVSPADGSVRWTFDTRTPMRSSPAVDGQGNVYVGGGDGRLYVVGPTGKLRWSMKLIDDVRNDLNASPALGKDAIYIGGESGQMFSVPYDFCLRPENTADPRCATSVPDPADGATLGLLNLFGDPTDPQPVDANGRVVLALSVRSGGASELAVLDTNAITVTTTPMTDVTVDVSGDGKFLAITPKTVWTPSALEIDVSAGYLVDLDRAGLRLSGGHSGGTATAKVTTTVNAPTAGVMDPSATYELRRMAVPLPTIMPSYNQIGFDSLHYLMGTVERNGTHGVAWMIGAVLPESMPTSVPDPTTKALFPLAVDLSSDVATMQAIGGLHVQVSNFSLPFASFRVATKFLPGGDAAGRSEIAGSAVCASIGFYGPFLQQLGLCNPQTDVVRFLGATDVLRRTDLAPPPSVGAATFANAGGMLTATLTGSQVKPAEHVVSLLAVDAATGNPVGLDYAFSGTHAQNPDGTLASLAVPTTGVVLPSSMRVYVMVDTTVGAKGTL